MVQVAEHLLSKHEVLSLNPVPPTKQNKTKKPIDMGELLAG
jgi:hypothetical protein